MSKSKPPQIPKKNEVSLVRSSAAEYLTFVAASCHGGVEAVYADENVWITQKMMGLLYDVDVRTINYHLKNVFSSSELEEDSVIRNIRITAADGKSYDTKHYKLAAIIAVGYKVNSERAVQFRKWATTIIEEFTIKGYTMDDERLKSGGSILSDQYFEEQLQRIREIRLSERKFYQKITDIYATSIDYDVTAQATKRFFATVQNKLHWAIHGQTAAEIIYHRADSEIENMGLTTWKDGPQGKIQKFDVTLAKNYLTEHEMAQLERLISAYLDVAVSMMMASLAAECQTLDQRLMSGLRIWVDGAVPRGKCGAPSSKMAMAVLSCAPASEMRAPRPLMSIADADFGPSRPASASQVVASYVGARGAWPAGTMTNPPAVSPATSRSSENSVDALIRWARYWRNSPSGRRFSKKVKLRM